MRPILIMNEEQPVKKDRLITIYKNNVLSDIERFSYKHAEGVQLDVKVSNAISADNSENLDGNILAEYVEFRDAKLRKKLGAYLAQEAVTQADDEHQNEGVFEYRLSLPMEFRDSNLKPLARFIHRYLVWGALFDWYSQFNMSVAGVYGSQLETIEDSITDFVKVPSVGKRPLQPFGPAKKMI